MRYVLEIDYLSEIDKLSNKLNQHPIFYELTTMEHLKIFMENHVFAVWDFMSLLKYIQKEVTCIKVPWCPSLNENSVRFINEIILSEESELLSDGVSMSHFSIYLQAMDEVNADTSIISNFIEKIRRGYNIFDLLSEENIPIPAKNFVTKTFNVIESGDLHKITAYFLYGREKIIPDMFIRIRDKNPILSSLPMFSEYLEKHIELDSNSHAPLARKLLNSIITTKKEEETSYSYAKQAIIDRIDFWGDLLKDIKC